MAEATVRKIVSALKKSIEWYAKNYGKVNQFIFKFEKGQMPRAWAGQRDRQLMLGEEERLIAAGIERADYTYDKSDWAAIIGFALETGMREQEIALAEFGHVWSNGRKLKIPKKNSKTKKERHALLSQRARDIIALQQASSPIKNQRIFHQFPNAKSSCDAFARLTDGAEIKNLRFHDLRHEATSRLCEKGVLKQMEIMEMTGHKTFTTFEGYVKLIAHENDRQLD
jgi:integrase